jgi:hypothetical protein
MARGFFAICTRRQLLDPADIRPVYSPQAHNRRHSAAAGVFTALAHAGFGQTFTGDKYRPVSVRELLPHSGGRCNGPRLASV